MVGLTTACTTSDPNKTLKIIAGSEQRAVLDQIVVPWCKDKGYNCEYTLKGSVDQARMLSGGETGYDAYWFASSVFAQLGNDKGQLSKLEPMFITPIVYAGPKSQMQKLGFVDNPNVGVKQILDAVESGRTTAWTTNPTQSNSGATVLFAFLNWFAGNGPGQPLTEAQLDSPKVDEGIKRFIQAMDRTPPSTGTMMDECIQAGPDACQTLFTYEDLVIEKNKELGHEGKEPFYAVYPQGALAISDAPLGFFPRTDATNEAKSKIFDELQAYLLHDGDAQHKLADLGRRPADSVGLTLENPDKSVFNPDWGIKTDIKEQGITYPAAAVIQKALDNYHIKYRKPVNIYYCLDGSGSMSGDGWDGVERAAHEIFDPERARVNLLQTGPEDKTTVAIFNSRVTQGPWAVTGNGEGDLRNLETNIKEYRPAGGTNMYTCLDRAVKDQQGDSRKKLIVLMTDGESQTSGDRNAIDGARKAGTPVIAIAFGDANPQQMKSVAEQTGGSFVENSDLVAALRAAAGYK